MSAPGGIPGPGGVWSQGVSAPGGCTWSRGYLLPGGVPGSRGDVWSWGGFCSWGGLVPRGVSAPGVGVCSRGYTWSWGGLVPGVSAPGGCTWLGTPPPCGQTDACKLITLPQTSFAGGNKRHQLNKETNDGEHCNKVNSVPLFKVLEHHKCSADFCESMNWFVSLICESYLVVFSQI